METCISFMNAVMFSVFYNLSSFIFSAKEESQTTLELLWYNSRWKGKERH